MANLSMKSNFQPNTWNEGYTEPKRQRLDNEDVEEQERSYRVANYSAKLSNKGEKASNVLLSNVRLNRKTGNETRRKTTKWETRWTGREGRANRAQRNRKRSGIGKNAGRKRATQRRGRKR